MDIVYIVRPGDDNEPLRYSLRTLVNLPHDRVWIVGHLPPWVHGVEHVPGNRGASKPQCVFDNVRIACDIPDLSDPFVMMNDDFFIMRPVEELPSWWRCPLDEHIASVKRWAPWKQSLHITRQWLTERKGIEAPRSYELHIPLLTDKTAMADCLTEVSGYSPMCPPQWRTIYGHHIDQDASIHPDVKVGTHGTWDPQWPFLSTYDRSFALGAVGEHIRSQFPDPSPYERTAPWPGQTSTMSPAAGSVTTPPPIPV